MPAFSWKDIPEERLNDNVTRRVFWGERVMLARFELAPDAQTEMHEHVSEQVTTCERGSVTLIFPDESEVALGPGDMLVIPGSKPHAARVGPEGAVVVDIFSPIRTDFIKDTAFNFGTPKREGLPGPPAKDRDAYIELQKFLQVAGIQVSSKDLEEVPLPVLARYVYERECISMGHLRAILGLDRAQAKALLREWKHGDDHSESSYQRKLERMIVIPSGLPPARPKPGTSDSSD